MTKFEECILHIGFEKTGTSSIQSFFEKNRTNLMEKNILFPKTFGKKDYFKLSVYACDDSKKDDLRKYLGLINVQRLENFRNNLTNSFRDEIKNTTCTKLLLSDEHLQSRLISLDEIRFLKKFLDNFVIKYKIIIYLRSQIEVAVSHYSNLCRNGGIRNSVLPKIGENHPYYNYEKVLDRWEAVFGHNNLVLRIFSRKEFPDGDIKKDFVRLLGLKWRDFIDVENYNESINVDAQRFLLEINKYLPAFFGDKPNKKRGDISDLVIKNRMGTGLLPTRQQAERFIKIFLESNERLKKKWFPERKEMFEVDFSKYPEKQNSEIDITLSFKIFAEIWSKKQQQIISLTRKIKEEDGRKKKKT